MNVFWGLKIVHKERLNDISNCIIAANHISLNDPPFIASIMPIEISFLAKSELFKNKIFGSLISYLNAIPIRRGAIDREALQKVEKSLQDGKTILIFPEGTRKSTKAKPGIGKIALETKTDIVPIYIENSNNFFGCLIRKKRLCIVIGERIKTDEYPIKENIKDSYREYSDFILKRIYELKNECNG
jgi:1-acyl-sn-glycerol-3-phosphate acyltransferase